MEVSVGSAITRITYLARTVMSFGNTGNAMNFVWISQRRLPLDPADFVIAVGAKTRVFW